MGIVLYSTGCPKCRVLETKLKAKGIGYAEINDVDVMEAKGIMNLPMLEVDGEILNFSEQHFQYRHRYSRLLLRWWHR